MAPVFVGIYSLLRYCDGHLVDTIMRAFIEQTYGHVTLPRLFCGGSAQTGVLLKASAILARLAR
jgi:hypothetical protein